MERKRTVIKLREAEMEKSARTKLAELPIRWHEAYTDKTEYLKDMYTDIVGPGSYFRFEGKNSDTGDEYFVVVGPSKVHNPKAMFFAGVRKLPSDYAAAGEEFDELEKAMSHAVETWGIKKPTAMGHYNASDLESIGQKVDKWREEHKESDKDEEDRTPKVGDQAPYKSVVDKSSGDMNMSGKYIYVETNEFPFYKKIYASEDTFEQIRTAMGAPARVGRSGYKWYDPV